MEIPNVPEKVESSPGPVVFPGFGLQVHSGLSRGWACPAGLVACLAARLRHGASRGDMAGSTDPDFLFLGLFFSSDFPFFGYFCCPLFGELVVCTPDFHGVRHCRCSSDFRYSSTRLPACSCPICLRRFRHFMISAVLVKGDPHANHRFGKP